jgi:kumamolisin
MTTYPLVGSERSAMPDAQHVGAADPAERFTVMLIVRRRAEGEFHALVEGLAQGDSSFKPLKRDEFEQKFGADPHDLALVAAFAKEHSLQVERQDAARRMVVLSGTVAQFNEVFGVALQRYRHGSGSYRCRTGVIKIPDILRGVITAVLGLDNRPQARTHFRFRPPIRSSASPTVSYTPDQVASLYDFPEGTGGGQCVALIELGGGYNAHDLQSYFSKIGVASPTVVAVAVGSGTNRPTGDAGGPDGEVMLDIEVVGAIVPGARIAVYFAENTDAGFIDAVSSAVHDAVNKPSVISISWGGPESTWTAQSMQSLDQVLQAAAAMGVTVCVASGDNGSSDGTSAPGNHVDFPASSPYALGCGGTSLHSSATAITNEAVWNDGAQGGSTGGGVSTFFALPTWQKGLQTTGKNGKRTALTKRGVPDVAGDADPATGYIVMVDGSDTVVGGTSAVAPLWAALIARINASQNSPVGYINPKLYGHPAGFNDITHGGNGTFAASPGWDACTGLGTPNGKKISEAL